MRRLQGPTVLVAALVALLLLALPAIADIEPNDTFDHAELIVPGTHPGTLTNGSDDVDIYRFTATTGQRVFVNVTADAMCSVYSFDGNHNPMNGSVENTRHALTWNVSHDSTVYAMVAESAPLINYTLTLEVRDVSTGTPGGSVGGFLSLSVLGVPMWLILLILLVLVVIVVAVAARRQK